MPLCLYTNGAGVLSRMSRMKVWLHTNPTGKAAGESHMIFEDTDIETAVEAETEEQCCETQGRRECSREILRAPAPDMSLEAELWRTPSEIERVTLR